MALNCLPVDQGKGQNPLTKIWLPYALQDSTLFLATLTFAEVHLEIMSGNYKSRRTLLHKGDSIKAVNAKLGDRGHALSNEAIGAVAMLAAMEVSREDMPALSFWWSRKWSTTDMNFVRPSWAIMKNFGST